MDIRVLRYFLSIAREGSITNAANVLHVTQPTLSRQIKDLEQELGAKLFIRGSHNVTLTPEGMRLRKRAEEILDMVDKTKSEFSTPTQTIKGDIYIGGGETKAMRHIAAIIEEMRQDYPDIRYHLYSGNAMDVTERLDKGLLDFGILIQPADLSKYDFVTLPFKDVWGIALPKDSPLAVKQTITRQDLIDQPLIFSRQVIQPTAIPNAFIDWFGDDYARLNMVATFNLFYNAAIMVEAGIGYAISIDGLINIGDNSNVCFRLLEPRLEAGLNIVWKKNQIFSAAASIFHQKILQHFANED